ncbi:MAG TPA: FMN-binding negative transcriptional regulator [Planctomycetota bacterium]|nr:FMN-binding negative transcriptional regulator [Planctomycetota bacterium]
MYIPAAFNVDDLPTLHAFMRQHSFATLVTPHGKECAVSHVPLLIEDGGRLGRLVGHVARANEHWKTLAAGADTLAIFHGPHAYISPSWYQTQPSVPTWNYAAVHASGRASLIEEASAVHELLVKMVRFYESSFAKPWQADEEFLRKLMPQIVAFEIEITKVEGKFKLSQNRPKDIPSVIAALEQSSDAAARETAALMKRASGL